MYRYDVGSAVTIYLDVRKDANGMTTPAKVRGEGVEDADGTIVLDSPVKDAGAAGGAAAGGGGGGVAAVSLAELAAMPHDALAARCVELAARATVGGCTR